MSKLYFLSFTELRIIGVTTRYARVSNKRLVETMTLNEELKNLGYTLNTEGIRRVANCMNIPGVLDNIREMVGNIDAKPMYPDFPNQVLNMDEAQYRLHQMIHYFSTYGVEWLTGATVDKGWTPNVTSTEKTEKDTRLLESKVIEVIEINDLPFEVLSRVLSKRERITDKERELILEALEVMNLYDNMKDLSKINIQFKQNLMYICDYLLDINIDTNEKLNIFQSLCKNTGDVWKVIDYCLTRRKYHFRTSQKRFFVKLLESYNIYDFKDNLAITNKKAERVKLLIKYLDYLTYSRNTLYSNCVSNLLVGNYETWQGSIKREIASIYPMTKDNEKYQAILNKCTGRPGIMLRWLTYLLRHGYDAEDITDTLISHSFTSELNTQTLVTILTKFGKGIGGRDDCERAEVMDICTKLLEKNLSFKSDKFYKRKVYIDEGDMDLSMSELLCNDKSNEGGYIRSGMAYRIPENVNRLRFFTYWDDKKRVDVDLHAYAIDSEGERIHVGWNSTYKDKGIVMSGDMTCSDSAEYIDVDLTAPNAPSYIEFIINIYFISDMDDEPSFKDIETCFVGMQVVDKIGEDVNLYNPDNCFFNHYLNSNCRCLKYGYLDLKRRAIICLAKAFNDYNSYNIKPISTDDEFRISSFTIDKYIDLLLRAFGCERANSRDEADIIFVMGKPNASNEISLVDNNFFMD